MEVRARCCRKSVNQAALVSGSGLEGLGTGICKAKDFVFEVADYDIQGNINCLYLIVDSVKIFQRS